MPTHRTTLEQSDIVLNHDVTRVDGWDEFIKSHPHGSPFHLMAWQRLIRTTFGFEPKHVVAQERDSRQICGVLPLFLVRSAIFGRMLVSTPQAAYGGVLAESGCVEDAIL